MGIIHNTYNRGFYFAFNWLMIDSRLTSFDQYHRLPLWHHGPYARLLPQSFYTPVQCSHSTPTMNEEIQLWPLLMVSVVNWYWYQIFGLLLIHVLYLKNYTTINNDHNYILSFGQDILLLHCMGVYSQYQPCTWPRVWTFPIYLTKSDWTV